MTGRIVHFEIPFDDSERAREFYREAFGWELMELPDMNYTLVTTGPSDPTTGPTEPGFINGGMQQRDPATVGTPVLVIDVEDIDASLARIEELGGSTLVARTEVGGMGWSAYFRDGEGNVLGLWQSVAADA
jgi:predicted enzyme related to lactoylglutathione lyase